MDSDNAFSTNDHVGPTQEMSNTHFSDGDFSQGDFSHGDFSDGEDTEALVFSDVRRGVYKRVVLRENRIVGVVLYGDTRDGGWYFKLMREGVAISGVRDLLLFGQAYMPSELATEAEAA